MNPERPQSSSSRSVHTGETQSEGTSDFAGRRLRRLLSGRYSSRVIRACLDTSLASPPIGVDPHSAQAVSHRRNLAELRIALSESKRRERERFRPCHCAFPYCFARFYDTQQAQEHLRLHQAGARTKRGVLPSELVLCSSCRAKPVGSLPLRPAYSLPELFARTLARALVMNGFGHTLELGIARELPIDFLLSLPSGPAGRLRRCLQETLPLNLEAMARVLHEGPGRSVEIARAVRDLAGRAGITAVNAGQAAILDELVALLLPLVGQSQLLHALTGAPDGDADLMAAPVRYEEAVSELQQVIAHPVAYSTAGAQPCFEVPEWLRALAQTRMPAGSLGILARSLWNMSLPELPYRDWDDYSRSCYSLAPISTNVLRCHSQRPDAPVPLYNVWALVRGYVDQPFFAQALDDETDPVAFLRVASVKTGLYALLYQVKASGGDGLSWMHLMRLVRWHFVEPAFIRSLPAGEQGVETASRVLRLSDFGALVAARPHARDEVVEVAAWLGVSLDYEALPGAMAFHVWLHINSCVPGLETGHLVQLFRELGRRDMLDRLTGTPDAQFSPAVPLAQLCPRAARFVSLAQDIRREPVAMLKFMARNNLAQHDGDRALPGISLAVRLLNSLAWDGALLERFQGFMQEYRAAPARLPGELAISNSGLPSDYACPITLDYMKEPVPTLGWGESIIYFEKRALLRALGNHPFHPVTQAALSPGDVQHL
ncbi:MAG: hypothetical protein OXC07_05205, partial [Kistimonas sp.]|nr:hypothetical protein [Kistimonas sp.]